MRPTYVCTYVHMIWIREVVYVQQMWRAKLENSSSLERVPDNRGVGIESVRYRESRYRERRYREGSV